EAVILAVIGKARLRPGSLNDLERFQKTLSAFRIGYAIGDIGARVAAAPHPKEQPSFADLIDCRGLLGETQRMTERQHLDTGANLYAARAGGDGAGYRQRRSQYRTARLLVNLGKPNSIEAPPIGSFDLRQRLLECLGRGLFRPAMEFMVDADFH